MFVPHKDTEGGGISVKTPISHSQLSKAGLKEKQQWRMLMDGLTGSSSCVTLGKVVSVYNPALSSFMYTSFQA